MKWIFYSIVFGVVVSIITLIIIALIKQKRVQPVVKNLFNKQSINIADFKFKSSYGFPEYNIYFQTKIDFQKAIDNSLIEELELFLQSKHKNIKVFEVERAINYYILGDKFPQCDFRRNRNFRLKPKI